MKAAQKLQSHMNVSYQPPHPYVSRGGVKLAAALDHFGLSPAVRVCLDVGASTGGFTQVLLERAREPRLCRRCRPRPAAREDQSRPARVIPLEGVNARELTRAKIPESPQAVVADVSFISLKQALPAALALASRDAWAVLLVKPQFELGRWGTPRTGVVKDDGARNDRARRSHRMGEGAGLDRDRQHGQPDRWAATATRNICSPPPAAKARRSQQVDRTPLPASEHALRRVRLAPVDVDSLSVDDRDRLIELQAGDVADGGARFSDVDAVVVHVDGAAKLPAVRLGNEKLTSADSGDVTDRKVRPDFALLAQDVGGMIDDLLVQCRGVRENNDGHGETVGAALEVMLPRRDRRSRIRIAYGTSLMLGLLGKMTAKRSWQLA